MGLVAQHALSTFTSPVNGTSPIDANTVRGNDNTIKVSYNAHDADPTIHMQSAAVVSRPATGNAGASFMATDTGAVYIYSDTGAAWVEVNYLRNTGGVISGAVTITTTTSPQVSIGYDVSNYVSIAVSSVGAITFDAVGSGHAFTFSDGVTFSTTTTTTGVATFTAQPIVSSLTASQAVFTDSSKGLVSNAITGTGSVVMSASPTLTGTVTVASLTATGTVTVTGATITGLTAASVATGTFPGVYTVTGALTLSAALTYGGVTLSNAVTGTGNMVLSAGPTFTGTAAFATVTTSSTIVAASTVTATGFLAGTHDRPFGNNAADGTGWSWGGNNSSSFSITENGVAQWLQIAKTTGAVTIAAQAVIGSGLTVSSGTTAVQALTVATDITMTSTQGIIVSGTRVVGVATTGLTVNATLKLFLDGVAGAGGDTYVYEDTGNRITVVTGGSPSLATSQSGTYIPSTAKLWLDGGGDTYIVESSANVMSFFVGGSLALTLAAGTVAPASLLLLSTAADLLQVGVALTDYSGASVGTLTNAPAAGNPTKWIRFNDNGTLRKIPCW